MNKGTLSYLLGVDSSSLPWRTFGSSTSIICVLYCRRGCRSLSRRLSI